MSSPSRSGRPARSSWTRCGSAGVRPEDLHALYLTGGSSHVPAIHRGLSEVLGGRPATLGDPKLVVALGAHHVPAGMSGTIVEPIEPIEPVKPVNPVEPVEPVEPRGDPGGKGSVPATAQRISSEVRSWEAGHLQLLCPVQGGEGRGGDAEGPQEAGRASQRGRGRSRRSLDGAAVPPIPRRSLGLSADWSPTASTRSDALGPVRSGRPLSPRRYSAVSEQASIAHPADRGRLADAPRPGSGR